MELEHAIMRNLVRISHNARRKLHRQGEGKDCKQRGYGHILDLLSDHKGLTQQQISQILGIRPQSASEAVTSLEEQGLIEKQPNPQDKRSNLLYITPDGLRRQAEMRQRRIENARRILAPLNEEEKSNLQQLLQKVVSALEENQEER